MNIIHEANQVGTRRLLGRYEPVEGVKNVWAVFDACVTAKMRSNRPGVPDDATTWDYEIWLPREGWAYTVRAVWRCGALYPPTATHTVITGYQIKDDSLIGDPAVIEPAVNEWLQGI